MFIPALLIPKVYWQQKSDSRIGVDFCILIYLFFTVKWLKTGFGLKKKCACTVKSLYEPVAKAMLVEVIKFKEWVLFKWVNY